MLLNLHVKNLALIDEIDVDFKSGLNILTGETGAGKSIILGSVHLALGGRYSKDMIRKGSDFGMVELLFSVENPIIEKELEKMDIFLENGQILLSRKIMEGRSVSRINGETVNMSTLRDVASLLIDIHGQHDHESLLHSKNHLTILDNYAKEVLDPLRQIVSDEFYRYQKCLSELKDATLDESERQRELSLLTYEINEIEEANLSVGEDSLLEEQYKRMTNGKKMIDGVSETYQYTGGIDGASDAINRALRTFSNVSDYDDRGNELYRQLVEVDDLLNDFNRELSDYEKTLNFSDEDFYAMEERLNLLNHLKSKYGNSIEEILSYHKKQTVRLEELQDYDTFVAGLESKMKSSKDKLLKASKKLSESRKQTAKSFVVKIHDNLEELNFPEVKFDMIFQNMQRFSANGTDDAEFYVSTNPGEEIKPLGNVASGGELSRIMLAIKTVMADKEDTPTLIFDEIDTGISGITAGKVASQMNIISKMHQVICITHLPQIAAMADSHFAIEKNASHNKTQTHIRLLNQKDSVLELARIIGGESITDAVVQSAKEMIDLSKSEKLPD